MVEPAYSQEIRRLQQRILRRRGEGQSSRLLSNFKQLLKARNSITKGFMWILVVAFRRVITTSFREVLITNFAVLATGLQEHSQQVTREGGAPARGLCNYLQHKSERILSGMYTEFTADF